MARLSTNTNVVSSDLDGAFGTDFNIYEVAAMGIGGIVALNSVAVLATVAPTYVGVMTAAAGTAGVAGYRTRKGLPLVPSFGKSDNAEVKPATDTTVTPLMSDDYDHTAGIDVETAAA